MGIRDGVSVFNYLNKLDRAWMGDRYVVFSQPSDPGGIIHNLVGAKISEVEQPQTSIEYYTHTGVGVRAVEIPIRYKWSELVLRGPVVRSSSFWYWTKQAMNALDLVDTISSAIQNITIVEYDTRSPATTPIAPAAGVITSAIDTALPIKVYFARGCVVSGFKPAVANSNGTDSLPLDEIRFKVQDWTEISAT